MPLIIKPSNALLLDLRNMQPATKRSERNHYATERVPATPGLIDDLRAQGFETAMVPTADLFVCDLEIFGYFYEKHVQKIWNPTIRGQSTEASILVKGAGKKPSPAEVEALLQRQLLANAFFVLKSSFDITLPIPRPYFVLYYNLKEQQLPTDTPEQRRDRPIGFNKRKVTKGELKLTCVELPGKNVLNAVKRLPDEEERALVNALQTHILDSGHYLKRVFVITHLQVQ